LTHLSTGRWFVAQPHLHCLLAHIPRGAGKRRAWQCRCDSAAGCTRVIRGWACDASAVSLYCTQLGLAGRACYWLMH
jgi:hypothetical protein